MYTLLLCLIFQHLIFSTESFSGLLAGCPQRTLSSLHAPIHHPALFALAAAPRFNQLDSPARLKSLSIPHSQPRDNCHHRARPIPNRLRRNLTPIHRLASRASLYHPLLKSLQHRLRDREPLVCCRLVLSLSLPNQLQLRLPSLLFKTQHKTLFKPLHNPSNVFPRHQQCRETRPILLSSALS
jgi:hypothetical protein